MVPVSAILAQRNVGSLQLCTLETRPLDPYVLTSRSASNPRFEPWWSPRSLPVRPVRISSQMICCWQSRACACQRTETGPTMRSVWSLCSSTDFATERKQREEALLSQHPVQRRRASAVESAAANPPLPSAQTSRQSGAEGRWVRYWKYPAPQIVEKAGQISWLRVRDDFRT